MWSYATGKLARLDRVGPADPGVRIGVVDGLPDLADPDLAGAAIAVETTMLPDVDVLSDRHATAICRLIFGARHGLATGCAGLVLPIFFPLAPQASPARASQMDIARALQMAAERGVAIVNISAGQRSSTAEAGEHLEAALALCQRRRILVVAAAGNDGCACLHVPAAAPTVLAVGAMDAAGRPHAASNFGSAYARNGILAPGVDLALGEAADGTGQWETGTSYAAAVVTGVAARLLSEARRCGYDLDPIDIRQILLASADPCDVATEGDCTRVLAGRLNLSAAIALLHRRGRSHTPTAAVEPSAAPIWGEAGMSAAVEEALATSAGGTATPGVAADAGAAVMQQGCACGGGEARAEEPARAPAAAASCGCGGGQQPQIAYTIGALWFDFGSEARYDALVQRMGDPVGVNNPAVLLPYLAENLPFASGITFILMQEQIPVYAVQPAGPFALEIYRAMLDTMLSCLTPDGDLQRVALPGLVSGTTRLANGMTLPVLYPDLRGMVKWRATELVAAARAAVPEDDIPDETFFNFLIRVYDQLRNFGLSPEDRALNFAATNAYQAAVSFADAAKRHLELDRITVRKSPICRPDSDCWDVQLVMFDPDNDRRAARFYRYTVDVSEVLPVTIGHTRVWNAPLHGA